MYVTRVGSGSLQRVDYNDGDGDRMMTMMMVYAIDMSEYSRVKKEEKLLLEPSSVEAGKGRQG